MHPVSVASVSGWICWSSTPVLSVRWFPAKAWRMLARSAAGSYQIFRRVQVLLPGLPASRLWALGWAPATSVFKPRYFVKYCSELIKTGEADEVK